MLPHKAAFESRWLQEAGTQVKWDDHDEEKEIASRSGADHRGLRRGRLKHDLSVDRQLDAQNPRARDGGERYVANKHLTPRSCANKKQGTGSAYWEPPVTLRTAHEARGKRRPPSRQTPPVLEP